MRTIFKRALILVASTAVLATGCSSNSHIDEPVTPSPQESTVPDPGTYNDAQVKAADTEVCTVLQQQVTVINQQMKDRQEGDSALEDIQSQLSLFLDEEADALKQASQTASDPLIPQDAEDFILTIKFLDSYISNGGTIGGEQNVAITDSNTPALLTLEQLEPVEAFQLQVAATETLEEEASAQADDEEYEHRIFGACYTLGVDIAPNSYNLYFTQEINS